MIGWLNGRVIEREAPGKLVINIQGVGYEVETSLPTFFKVEAQEEDIELHIHTIVREDAILLYGFSDKEERALFRALIKVNGVGPKLAIAILSSISPEEFIQSIQEQNTALLTRLPGIGKKTAERLIVEMKDRLQQVLPDGRSAYKQVTANYSGAQREAIQALEALGYKQNEATKAIKQIGNDHQNCEQLIREALRLLSTN